MRIKSFSLLLLGITTLANAATISFTQVNNDIASVPFYGKAAGINGMGQYAFLGGNTFSIQNATQGVINTNITIGDNLTIPFWAAGSLGWSSQQSGCGNGGSLYTFSISAGGNPGVWDPKNYYTIAVAVDGNQVGKNSTSASSYWNPTLVNNVCVTTNSNISVTLTPIAQP
ncbi:MAG: hypothetical protein ORN24_06670 [Burkholderiales bacterium]|jgi:hypothetical protein|nr:hypothetical protein [Burkholderiales bacterium]